MTSELKDRVEKALVKAYENQTNKEFTTATIVPSKEHYEQKAREFLPYLEEFIKELQEREEKLVETVKWYADWNNYDDGFSPFSITQHENCTLKFESLDQGEKARSILKELGVEQ